ncbi:MAG: hypothetical protein KGZ25_10210 [Planctomycetes bacterium]|nr:hypothetical protein [Planctomycetota bacterium]
MRKCPGEKYPITLAVCQARQAKNYPKCLLCKYYTGQGPSTDPKVKKAIFRTASIAGEVSEEINEYVVRKLGTATAQYFRADSTKGSSLVVGCDLRENSRHFARVFSEGANAGGMHVVSVGPSLPEIVRFAVGAGNFSCGAFITGCHAPADVNGIRLWDADARQLTFDQGLDKIGLIARRIKPGHTKVTGKTETIDPMEDYRKYVQKFALNLEPLVIALDGSWGVAGKVLPRVLAKQPVELVKVHCGGKSKDDFLGRRFPAQSVQNALENATISNGADLGIALDFDGDICAFFDEKGQPIRTDIAAAVLARELLQRIPGAKIAYDLRFTAAVREEILKSKGQPLRTSTDPHAVATRMRRSDGIYGAHLSGRHFFRDMFGGESPVIALLVMCSAISRQGAPLSEIAGEVTRYAHSGELRYLMPSPEALERAVFDIQGEFPNAERDTLEGLTLRFPNWWFNVRRQTGSSVILLNIEGRMPNDESRGRKRLEKLIRNHGGQKAAR